MTIRFNNIQDTYDFFENGNLSSANVLTITSMHDHRVLLSSTLTVVEANERYTHFELTPGSSLGDQHLNGLYRYMIYEDTTALSSGIIKVITEPGGETGTEPYISNNENREGVTYFRPSY